MTFLRETGLRISEACSIPRATAEGWHVVSRFRRKAGENVLRIIGKGDVERVVVVTDEAVRASRVLLARANNGHLWPWTDRGTRYLFEQAGQRAGGIDAHPHRFRHTFATELVESGVRIEIVADMLGHSSSEITRLYWSASRRAKAEALARRRRFLRHR
jgi:site-specific recombinase XerD